MLPTLITKREVTTRVIKATKTITMAEISTTSKELLVSTKVNVLADAAMILKKILRRSVISP